MTIIQESLRYMRGAFKARPPKPGIPSLGGRNFDSSTNDRFTAIPLDWGRLFGVVETSYQHQTHALQLAPSGHDKRHKFYAESVSLPQDFHGYTPDNYDLLFGKDEEL
jgi:hypothetical protein